MALYAIGDVHGCLKTLDKLINALALTSSDKLILLGDYIDRGPDSKGVLDLVRKLSNESDSCIALKGNHEAMMHRAVVDPTGFYYPSWMVNGGEKTMASFGAEVLSELDPYKDYITYIDELPLFYKSENFIFAHAGLNLENDDPFSDEKAILWIRDWYDIDRMKSILPGKYIIHGHTPVPINQVESQLKQDSPFINLDTGCVYKDRHKSMGYLTAINMDSSEIFTEKNIDF
ncbi:MAG: serine/threonine protein phosphatase 1 [Limisphaerales bacterium]|jgi:serine/threonine protein phosphatase 1